MKKLPFFITGLAILFGLSLQGVVNAAPTSGSYYFTNLLEYSTTTTGCLQGGTTGSGIVTTFFTGTNCGSGSGSKWATSSSDSTAIYPAGALKVGIGTTSPYSTLSVVGTTTAAVFEATTTATSTFGGGLDIIGSGWFCKGTDCAGRGTINTGTLGYTPYYTGSNTVLSPNAGLFQDIGNSRVGVNTTVPNSALEINGDLYFTTGGDAIIRFDNNTSDALNILGGDGFNTVPGDINIYAGSDGDSLFQGGDVYMWPGTGSTDGNVILGYDRITANRAVGNVGIGTTSPYAKLSVVGEAVASHYTATTTATSTFGGSLDVTETNATSTFAGGISLSDGCIAMDNTCLVNTANVWGANQSFLNIGLGGTAPVSTSLFNANISGSTVTTNGSIVATYTGSSNSYRGLLFNPTYQGTGANPTVTGISSTVALTADPSTGSTVSGVSVTAGLSTTQVITQGTHTYRGLSGTIGSNAQTHSGGTFRMASVYGAAVPVLTGVTSQIAFAGLFADDVQLHSNKKLILEGSDTAKGDTYIVASTTTGGIHIFEDAVEIFAGVAGNVGIGTTSPYAKLSVVGETVSRNFTATSTTDTSALPLLGVSTGLTIPNGTGPTVDAAGKIAFDSTDNQFLVGTSTAYAAAIPTIQKLWSSSVASTSLDFVSGGRIPMPQHRDGVVIKEIHCFVDGGTSKVINIDTFAGGANTDSVTCDADGASDTAMSANYTITAGAPMALEMGATTGTVDYVSFSIWGTVVAE